MTTVLRSKDYKVAVTVLENDSVVIKMAQEVAKVIKPEYSHSYDFMKSALAEYTKRNGINPNHAHHHIGAVAESIRKINKW